MSLETGLPSLEALREELETGLAETFLAGAAGGLSPEEARAAARSVLAGEGGGELLASRFGDRPVGCLYGFDADSIQRWVFASERIPVARGASQTLSGINERFRRFPRDPHLRRRLPGVFGVVYSAGGGGVLLGNAGGPEERERRARQLRDWLEQGSSGLTFTTVALPLFAPDLLPAQASVALPTAGVAALHRFACFTGLPGALVRLQILLRREKEEKPRLLAERLAARPGTAARRCPSCGRRPPAPLPPRGDRWDECCSICRKLRRHGRAQQPSPAGEILTFADLARAGKGRRPYLGFVALDGNGMGGALQQAGSLLDLRVFSDATSQVYEEARRAAVEVLTPDFLAEGWDASRAHLSLLSGGDEITLVLPAAAALPAALCALESIEAGFDALCRPGGWLARALSGNPALLARLAGAGAAAGIVLARPQFPVRLLRGEADALQKRAKGACGPGGLRSALAWQLAGEGKEEEGGEWSLDSCRRLLHEAHAAGRHRVPGAAFQALLEERRREAAGLRALPPAARTEVLSWLSANFFRYQLARHDGLSAFWREVGEANGDGGEDGVQRWFAGGGGERLEDLVGLLGLGPPAVAGEATP